ncbi:MAG TPA: hypothetical protein VN224_15430, partial [Xanthomonadales bacterium]|nr:hypothetical protein [Xanthomonadales bacterium]
MRRLLLCIILAPAIVLVPHEARAAVPAGTSFTAVRAPHPMALDPSLRDPAWQAGRLRPETFWNLTTRAPAQFGTDVSILYDDRSLYVAFRAEQRGAPLVAGQ